LKNTILFGIISFLMAAGACTDKNNKSLTIATFDGDSYGDWEMKGEAFPSSPSGEEGTHQMIGYQGKGFASSLDYQNESASGSLTSPPFTIEKKSIHFMLGAHHIHFLNDENPDDLAVQLLIDNEVVSSKVPANPKFHAMFWQSWDVEEFIGQSARFRILDQDSSGWAHIDVDQIVQTDLPVNGQLMERRMQVSAYKINFPVKEGAERYYVRIFNGGEQVRGVDVELAPSPSVADYWVVTDLSKWQGQEIILRTRQYGSVDPSILEDITFANDIIDSENLYQELLRPQFHFSSKRGWINDPNGLVYNEGKYHLFYQHNPYGWDHSRNDFNKTWGHAVSTDLVHWKELPGAIHPDSLGSIYSGSSAVDHLNTAGFQTGDKPPIISMYTSAGDRVPWGEVDKFTQSLAYSNDGGKTFEKYEGNPVLENLEYINRDPRLVWFEPTSQWVMVLWLEESEGMGFFNSKDLRDWELQSIYQNPTLMDTPELFQLAIDGNKQNKKWILYGGSGHYVIGEFDGKRFYPEGNEIKFNYGNAFYASQTFNNVPEYDGRRIQMAWGTTPTPGMPFNQIMLFPVQLTLHTTDQGLRIFARPVEEISNIYRNEHSWKDLSISVGEKELAEVSGELFDITVIFEVGEAEEMGLVINGQTITYNRSNNVLYTDEMEARVDPENGEIKLRVLADRTTTEIFVNDGRIYMPVRAKYNENGLEKRGIKLFAKGSNANITLIKVYELKSIW